MDTSISTVAAEDIEVTSAVKPAQLDSAECDSNGDKTKDKAKREKKKKEPKVHEQQHTDRKPPQGRPGGERPRRTSVAFDAFYHANLIDTGLIKAGEEWEAFIDCLNRPLPSSLWITPTATDADEVRNIFRDYQKTVNAMKSRSDLIVEGKDEEGHAENVLNLEPLSWMPDDMGWRVDVPKRILRKDKQFKPLHEMLIEQTAKGTINRMEEVSMLPVAMLDVGAGHHCLDMCASPGNKTAQMLSLLADANYKKWGRGLDDIQNAERLNCQSVLRGRIDYSADEGSVIANEISSERCGMLVHQIARHQSLYPLVLFTSHDARFFPSVRSPEGSEIMFDRILCDVMCSSDGTMRKSPHLWREWTPKHSLELNTDQLAVALRAARLLKVGGRMVYSTCSMSPIENEAVVAELLRCCQGSLELVDARNSVAPFQTCIGLREWRVAHPSSGEMFASYSAVVEADAVHKLIRPCNFPPPQDSAVSLALPKCVRILPHHNDTSGFFVAVLEKVGDMKAANSVTIKPGEEQMPHAYDSDVDEDGEERERQRQLESLEKAVAKGRSEQERVKATSRRERVINSGSLARELSRYKRPTEHFPELVTSLSSFYGMHERFPMHLLFCRYQLDLTTDGTQVQTHQGESNQLFLCAGGVIDYLMHGTGAHAKRQLKVVAGGLRAFEKDRLQVCEKSSKFRFSQEALEFMLPFVGSRLVDLEEAADTRRLVLAKGRSAPINALTSPGRTNLESLSPGGCVLFLRTQQGERISVSALRISNAVNLYINDLMIPALRKACGLPVDIDKPVSCVGETVLESSEAV